MQVSAIPVESIEVSPFDSRLRTEEISKLANSLRSSGQLVPIRVRASPSKKNRYQLICGHRRLLAARMLGWRTISAEIVQADDHESAIQSFVENYERNELTDYEKGLVFERFSTEFNMTYEEIGDRLGISRQTVSNYLAMARLFSKETISSNPELILAMQKITEHHSRVLSQVSDLKTRRDLVIMVAKDGLSVKELANIVHRLRSWFVGTQFEKNVTAQIGRHQKKDEEDEIRGIISSSFESTREKNYGSFEKIHLFNEGYSLYSAFGVAKLEEAEDARAKEREWFYEIAPNLTWNLSNFKVSIFGNVAVATLTVLYRPIKAPTDYRCLPTRGTVVLLKQDGNWRILHEHYSTVNTGTDTSELNEKSSLLINR